MSEQEIPESVAQINREVMQRCRAANIKYDCGADGAFTSEIAIVGDWPSERDAAMKLPFVGGSGKFLWDVLRKNGYNRRSFYVTNAIKRRVWEGDDGEGKLNKGELDQWEGLLHWELSQLPNLKYILVLGNQALKLVTGNSGVTLWRGSVVPAVIKSTRWVDRGVPVPEAVYKEVTVFCALNPATVAKEPLNDIVFRFDMDRFDDVIKGTFKPHLIEEIINPSFSDAMDWVRKMKSDKLPISLDIEVISMETACIGLANDAHTGMCINWRTMGENRYSLKEEKELRHAVQDLMLDPEARFVAQNGSFDSYWLWYKDRMRIRKLWFDTLLAHHTLYPPLPHSLAFLTSQYTTHPYYKDDGKSWKEGGDIDQFWRYNVKDCCVTLAVAQRELEELRSQGLEDFFFSHVMHLQPHLVHMTVHGVKCDVGLKNTIATELATEVEKLRVDFIQKAQKATGEEDYTPNPKSPKQMHDLYFKKLRLVGRGQKADAKNRQRMMDHPRTNEDAKAVIKAHNAFAKDDKFLTTYAEMSVDPDMRIRCEYKQQGVQSAPGRLSSAAVMWGCGMNLQNQPDRSKPMFIADGPDERYAPEGYCFVYFDLAQVEARIVGWLAPVPKWKEQFERARLEGGYDAHRALASDMFNIPYDEVPKDDRTEDGEPTVRFIAKRCRHGLNYRMAADRLAETTGMSMRDAERNYSAYHRVNPEIRKWWDDTMEEVRTKRSLWSPKGRRWILLERLDDEATKSVIAFKPQSTAGDHVSGVIYKCHEDPDWPKKDELHYDARIILNIHDALIALCKIEDHKRVMKIMRKHAEEPIIIRGEPLIVPADFAVSVPDDKGIHRWSTLKKIKNFEEYVNS